MARSEEPDRARTPDELVDEVTAAARDALHVAVGLGVLGVRQANITRLAVRRNVEAARRAVREAVAGPASGAGGDTPDAGAVADDPAERPAGDDPTVAPPGAG
jgi:hypothetical protein